MASIVLRAKAAKLTTFTLDAVNDLARHDHFVSHSFIVYLSCFCQPQTKLFKNNSSHNYLFRACNARKTNFFPFSNEETLIN